MTETQQAPWWRGAVIYQVYPRSFLDSNGDGIGDLPGIVRRLDHIAGLGVDAVWISPFFKSPMRDFGYDVADYRSVDPMFGSNRDFERLIAEAHVRGLKVIVDMVLAHTSDEHAWFEESRRSRDNPKADWYVWAAPKPDGSPPNNWQSVFGGPSWQWDPRRSQYYLHHFLKSQPNLNWHNPAVVEAMLAETEFWLQHGVDGLRLDAITSLVHDAELRDNPPKTAASKADIAGGLNSPFAHQEHVYDRDRPEIMDCFRALRSVTERHPDRFMVGEVADVDSIDATARYTSGREALHTAYTFQLTQRELTWERLRSVVERFEAAIGDGWATFAFSNHDCVRAVTRFAEMPSLSGDRPALAKLLMALLLSLRGSACIYQGEELGLTEADLDFALLQDPWGIEMYPANKGRDGCRTPIPWAADAPNAGFSTGSPWLPLWHEHLPLAVDRQDVDAGSVLNAYRRFLAWRRRQPTLIAGDFAMRDSAEPIIVFERRRDAERLLCAFNFSNEPAELPVEENWQATDVHGFAATLANGRLALPPFGAFFARQAG
ncbi:MAG: alpha-glucosidase [Inquilinus sp.]|nr:alpha-glucosidase [Inquilinus sp.]